MKMKMKMKMSCLDEGSSPDPAESSPAAAVRLELTRGQERLAQLQELLLLQEDRPPAEGSPAAGSLVQDALSSIKIALSMLDQPNKEAAEAPADPAAAVASGSCSDEQESKKTRKIQQPRMSVGFRRRFQPYKSRKTESKTMDDEYTWRKYGQKEIHGSKFPRNYFRCTHKYDRLCQARKQVQLSEEDPSMFVITYMGEHTCANMYPSEYPLDQGTSTCIIDFSAAAAAGTRFSPSAAAPAAPKQECVDEEVVSSLTVGSSSSSELILPVFSELPELGGGGPAAYMEHFTALTDQYCDVTSGLQYSSSSGMGMEFLQDEAFEYEWCV